MCVYNDDIVSTFYDRGKIKKCHPPISFNNYTHAQSTSTYSSFVFSIFRYEKITFFVTSVSRQEVSTDKRHVWFPKITSKNKHYLFFLFVFYAFLSKVLYYYFYFLRIRGEKNNNFTLLLASMK